MVKLKKLKEIDKTIFKIMRKGFNFALILTILSTYILYLYKYNPISHIWFESGYLLLKTSISIFSSFFVCGYAFDKIKSDI